MFNSLCRGNANVLLKVEFAVGNDVVLTGTVLIN